MKRLRALCLSLTLVLPVGVMQTAHADALSPAAVVHHYARMVLASYEDSLAAAEQLQQAIDDLLLEPNADSLEAARDAWRMARLPYLQTEVYRFYDGPIDVTHGSGEPGPEGRLNAWPLNEAYIDAVEGHPQAGIIHDLDQPLSREFLIARNQADDEADVATGYHAIEFLLWGQDFNPDGPGNRPHTDYLPGDTANERRRDYLRLVTALLVDDLRSLVDAWQADADNYARAFRAVDPAESLTKILNGAATLSGFELSAERLGTALDSGDQEDEQSCFSDNTHVDFIENQRGIRNVLSGSYTRSNGEVLQGPGVLDLLRQEYADLAQQLEARLVDADALAQALPTPFDQAVLAAEPDSEGRRVAERLVQAFQAQALLIQQAGEALGLTVQVASD